MDNGVLASPLKLAAVVLAGGAFLLAAGGLAPSWRELRGERPPVPRADADAAVEAIQSFAAMVRHLHGSGGDPRFAERLGASPEIAAELAADVQFLRGLRQIEDATLVRADVLGVTSVATGGVEVRTREYWVFHARQRDAGREEPPPVSAVVFVRYELTREAGGWIVSDWTLEPPAEGS